VIVLIAFAVATLSLLVQGATLGPLLRRIAPKVDRAAADEQFAAERTRIMELLFASSQGIPAPDRSGERTLEGFFVEKTYMLAVLEAQRSALLDARDNGTFDAELLANELANLDAAQIAIELRGTLPDTA
jgi:monovalent cation/hydrogen antiporter